MSAIERAGSQSVSRGVVLGSRLAEDTLRGGNQVTTRRLVYSRTPRGTVIPQQGCLRVEGEVWVSRGPGLFGRLANVLFGPEQIEPRPSP